jgi:hypothetical protein
MPIDSIEAKDKNKVFDELCKANPTNPVTKKPYNWKIEKFIFQVPDASFLQKAKQPLDDVFTVAIQSKGSYYDVFLELTQGEHWGQEGSRSPPIGTISES